MERHSASRSSTVAAGAAARLQQLAERVRGHRVVHRLWGMLDEARGAARQRLPEVSALGRQLAERILAEPASPRQTVVNATGVILPDHLDIAWPLAAAERMAQLACATTSSHAAGNDDGPRGDNGSDAAYPHTADEARDANGVRHILRQVTGAEATLILHSPSAALTAVIGGLAPGGEVLVARSQVGVVDRQRRLTLAEVTAAAGSHLREVGSVERVSAAAYAFTSSDRSAAGRPPGLILHVVPADYAILGATSQPPLDEIAAVAQRGGWPLVEFLPSALLTEIAGLAWSGPIVGQSLAAGADLVVFDGQRCLGGPPCGIVVGRRELLERIAAQPLCRMLAADPLTIAALESTLALARDSSAAERSIPLWQLLTATPDALRHRAQRLAPQVANCVRVARAEVIDGVVSIGPGQLPSQQLRDWCVAVEPTGGPAEQLAEVLRGGRPSVWAAVERGRLMLHLRSVLARDDEHLAAAFNRLGTRSPVSIPAAGNDSPGHSQPPVSPPAGDELPAP